MVVEMGSAATEIGLELKLCAARTVGGFLKEVMGTTFDGGVSNLEESVRRLEEERRKIEAFKRELPLCMFLLTDVIDVLKKELDRFRGERFTHSFKEFIPMRSVSEEEDEMKLDCKDKMHWMSSAQLWSNNSTETKSDDDKSITDERNGELNRSEEKEDSYTESKSPSVDGVFVPFKGLSTLVMNSKEELKPITMLPDLSLLSPAMKSTSCSVSAITEDNLRSGSASKAVGRAPQAMTGPHLSLQVQQQQQQPPRKTRRCWSPELHRRFVIALQQLGGAQVATPKQIRELMKVDGITNDEVKSHLQKYRLHTRKMPNSSASGTHRPLVVLGGLWVPPENYTTSTRQSVSPSGSPQSPLQLTCSNQADGCEEEDGKSESYNWR
ncbi:hypothetical protein Cni_G24200 [Canna indica]|uniref:HTH myb-type domain-containing protein n=1 Tax=Canna indica TaxID=4628 RepID=A0AAQ3QL87_9LILI|nr:hypothetical protein Cni_G24200 [Canna indica]